MNNEEDIFATSEEEKKALSKKRVFYVLVAMDIAMVILLVWEIIELFLV